MRSGAPAFVRWFRPVRWSGVAARGGWLGGTLVGVATTLSPAGTAILMLIAGLAWLCATSLPMAAGLLLAVRSSLDILTDRGIPIGPVRINAPGAIGLAVAGLALLVLLDRALRRRSIDWGGRPALGLALFSGFALVQIPNGLLAVGPAMVAIGFKEVIRLASLLGLYLLLVNLQRTMAERRLLLRSIYVSLIVPCGYALWQYVFYRGQGLYDVPLGSDQPGRLQGTFFHPNTFGIYLAFVITLSATLLRRPRFGVPAWVLLPVIGGAGFLLAFTASRTAWLFLAICLGVKLWLHPRRFALPLLVGLGLAAALVGPRVAARFEEIDAGISLRRVVARRELSNSLEWRIYNWYVLAQVGLRRPLIGHGFGSTSLVNPLQSVDRLAGRSRGFSAHNEFVRFFVEGGLVGVVLLSAVYVLWLGWCVGLVRGLRRARDDTADLAGVATEFVVGLIILSLFAANPLDQTSVLYYFLALVAVLRGVERGGGHAPGGRLPRPIDPATRAGERRSKPFAGGSIH